MTIPTRLLASKLSEYETEHISLHGIVAGYRYNGDFKGSGILNWLRTIHITR